MNDLVWIIFWGTWLLLVDLVMLIIHVMKCRRLQKSISRATLATSTRWKERCFPLSFFLMAADTVNVFFIPVALYFSQEAIDDACAKRYLPMECDSATEGWEDFYIWLVAPGIIAMFISILCVSLARRQLAARSRNNNTSSPQLLYHPGPLLFANGFLALSSICCTLSGGPDILYRGMNFKTWLHVTKALRAAAICTYIVGSILTVYGSVRLFFEVHMHRAHPRPRAHRARRGNRQAQREWLEMA